MKVEKVEIRRHDGVETIPNFQSLSLTQMPNSKLCKLLVFTSRIDGSVETHVFEPIELLRSNGVEMHFLWLSIGNSGTGVAPEPVLIVLS